MTTDSCLPNLLLQQTALACHGSGCAIPGPGQPAAEQHVRHGSSVRGMLFAGVLLTTVFCYPIASVPLDTCGWLYQHGDCIVFEPTNCCEAYPTDLTALPDSALYTPIRLQGELESCSGLCNGLHYSQCVTGAVIVTCEPIDLGCGVLSGPHYDEYCYLWTSPIYGRLLTGSHGYSHGDTLRAVGIVDHTIASICMFGDGHLFGEILYICDDSLTTVQEETWGRIKSRFR